MDYNVESSVLCLAVGDALGVAYENKTRQQIHDIRSNHKNRNENITNNENNYKQHLYPAVISPSIWYPANWPRGRWTDDTQLTLAMMRTCVAHLTHYHRLIQFRRDSPWLKEDERNASTCKRHPLLFTPLTFTQLCVENGREFALSTIGWGGTKDAVDRVIQGTHTYNAMAKTANPSLNVNAVGNGVLMKLFPMALLYSFIQTTPSPSPSPSPSSTATPPPPPPPTTTTTTTTITAAATTTTTTTTAIEHALTPTVDFDAFMDDEELEQAKFDDAIHLTLMTHGTPSASICTCLLMSFISLISRMYFASRVSSSSSSSSSSSLLSSSSSPADGHFLSVDARFRILTWLLSKSRQVENRVKHVLSALNLTPAASSSASSSSPTTTTTTIITTPATAAASTMTTVPLSAEDIEFRDFPSVRLSSLLSTHSTLVTITDDEILKYSNGGTFHCVDSLMFVILYFLRHDATFETIVAATLMGGDTDSNSSIIGSLIGLIRGNSVFGDLVHTSLTDLHQLQPSSISGSAYLTSLYRLDELKNEAKLFNEALNRLNLRN